MGPHLPSPPQLFLKKYYYEAMITVYKSLDKYLQ